MVARSAVFWWQGGLLLAGTALIWSRLPFSLVKHPFASFPPLEVVPSAAFVKVDSAFARAEYKKIFSAWFARPFGRTAGGMELGGITLDLALPAPRYLGRNEFPAATQSAFALPAPALELPEVELPNVRADELVPQPRKSGIRIHFSPELAAAHFEVPEADRASAAFADGVYRFAVEISVDGLVEHLILLSAPSGGAAAAERLLQRAHASGPVRGIVTLSSRK